jgi:hypothetical protein
LLAGLHVNLTDFDIAFLPQEIATSFLEIQSWVATAYAEIDVDGVTPFAFWIICIDIEMFARGEYRCYHIESAFVITDGGGIDARLLVHPFDSDLRLAGEAGAHLLPMNQILTMKHGHARIILEGAVYQIEVIAGATHGGVSMKAGEYGITKSLSKPRKSQHHGYYDNKKLLHFSYKFCCEDTKDPPYLGDTEESFVIF